MSFELLYGFPSREGLGMCDKRPLRLFVIQSGAKRSEKSRMHPRVCTQILRFTQDDTMEKRQDDKYRTG